MILPPHVVTRMNYHGKLPRFSFTKAYDTNKKNRSRCNSKFCTHRDKVYNHLITKLKGR